MPQWFSNLTVVGLGYDIVGVIVLAWGVFWKSTRDIANEAGTYWTANPFQKENIIKSQIDTISGLIFLVLGFTLQIFGALKQLSPNEYFCWVLWVFLFLFVIVYPMGIRPKVAQKRINKVDLKTEEKKKEEDKRKGRAQSEE
jgi:hypothetical protein